MLFDKKEYKDIVETIHNKDDIYFIGRGLDYYSLLEASLKLKEISYIHSDTYQAGELKHGPIALIEKQTPLFVSLTDDNLKEKVVSNMLEAKARGAYIILITISEMEIDKNAYDKIIRISGTNDFIQVLISIIPFQILSYEIAKKRECDIDKPRNLAKSVTVE
jgi:glucosamine--fructose-6-phosphate aminotransferase (isomerizing)